MTSCKFEARSIVRALALGVLILIPTTARAQSPATDHPDRTVDAKMRAAVIEKVIQQLNQYYIDPELARKMEESLRGKLRQGAFDTLVEQREFLSRVTDDLRSVSHDLHLGVWPIEMSINAGAGASEEERRRVKALARYNHNGVLQVARLHGNIGYLELSYFEGIEQGGETAVAAMNWLAGTDALIIDVRRNGGGSDVVSLILSYLFPESVHTLDIFSKIDQSTRQIWTMPYVPGSRLADIPVYILLSRRSASAAEDLAYSLKTHRRAILVGEVSRGAANPIEEFSFPELSICMAVSAYRVASPVTGTCWEGVGVEPHIAVPAEKALDAACVEAMKALVASDAGEEIKTARTWALEMYRALLDPVTLEDKALSCYAGSFGSNDSVSSAEGRLSLINKKSLTYSLIPLGGDRFAIKEEEAIVRFVRDEAGIVTRLDIQFPDGFRKSIKKDRGPRL